MTQDSDLTGDDLLDRIRELELEGPGQGWRHLLSACRAEIAQLREALAESIEESDAWERKAKSMATEWENTDFMRPDQ